MKKILLSVAALAVSTVASFAAELSGVVASVDAAAMKVVLEDGSELTVAEGVDLSAIEAGETVNIVVDDATGSVTEILVAE